MTNQRWLRLPVSVAWHTLPRLATSSKVSTLPDLQLTIL